METQLLINKLLIIRQILEPPMSDVQWGIHKIDLIITELEREQKSKCQCGEDRTPFFELIDIEKCTTCGKECY